MNLERKYILVATFILILAPITVQTFTVGRITATDWVYRHSVWIGQYLAGDFSMLVNYPPLFHLVMSPFVAASAPVIYLQIVFTALNAVAILWFMRRDGENAVLIAAMLLATSLAFLQMYGSLMPQSLDLLILLPTLVLYLRGRYFPAALGIVGLLFVHLAGAFYFTAFLVHALLTKRYQFVKWLVVIALAISPLYFNYIFGFSLSGWDVATQSDWESQFLGWRFFFTTSLFAWLLLPWTLKRLRKANKLTETQLFYIIWAAVFVPLAFTDQGLWRAMSFIVIPFIMLTASVLK